MYAQKPARGGDQRQPYHATLLYTFFYTLLWIYRLARKAYIALQTLFKRIRIAAIKTHTSQQKQPRLQDHLAISGAISLHLEQLARLIAFAVDCGTRHITLYDHLRAINPNHLTFLLCRHDLPSIQISEIGVQKTHTHYSRCERHGSSHESYLTAEKPRDLPEIHLTLVKPGTGRAAIARSARMLAQRQTIVSPEITPDDVVEWLDKDEARCMLPSEPDTLVVFPSPGTRSIPILNEFPIWQLRLTQIRFSSRPITELSTEDFSDMVSSAARAQRRFGR